ncbi:MAG: Rieske 2Fe-2S domain-containing protein [Beijerinckiaceae bacterium]|nr:Rieske 2Fe-2S domain-containing protein [Beijerinckiaceae bacterium]
MAASNLEPASGIPDASRIVSEGVYYRVSKCAGFDETYARVKQAFYDGVRTLAGVQAEQAVRRDGLGKIHLHFPTEKVLLLEAFVETALRDLLYKWSWRVGKEDLHLRDPFYIDHLIVIRIHFPFDVARKAKHAEHPRRSASDFLAHAISALRDPRIVINQVSRAIRRSEKDSAFAPDTFHGALAKPARSHGAHIDTWYGHSFDGINLWWSIEGVNALNSVILYPDMAGRPLRYDPRSMYLARGVAVSEPRTMDLKPGELLLFNPEMLHSTHVNVSDETRVALTTRINPSAPKFNDEAPFNMEHWHVSTNIEKNRFAAMRVFPASKHRGTSAIAARPALDNSDTLRVTIATALGDVPTGIIASSKLEHGMKLAVDFADAKILVWRNKEGALKAWSRLCPHVGVDLADGWHDENSIYCPGHGLAFDFESGTSACASFRLAEFIAEDAGGQVQIRRAVRKHAKRERAQA